MGNGLSGIRYDIEKAKRTDGRVQNLARYINAETLKSTHMKMDAKKALGIDNVS